MSYWVEIHCDSPPEEKAPNCVNMHHIFPMGMASNRTRLGNLVTNLHHEARCVGWIKKQDGWWCHRCANNATDKEK